jgi:hypothetical protein
MVVQVHVNRRDEPDPDERAARDLRRTDLEAIVEISPFEHDSAAGK